MAWYLYLAVFFGAVLASMAFLAWATGTFKAQMLTEEERAAMGRAENWWSNLIIIGLLSVIVVFLFVERS